MANCRLRSRSWSRRRGGRPSSSTPRIPAPSIRTNSSPRRVSILPPPPPPKIPSFTNLSPALSPPLFPPARSTFPPAFRLGPSGPIPPRVAYRSDLAAPLGRFVHGRIDRRLERARFSDCQGQLSPLLCRRQPRTLRTRSAHVRRAIAEFCQHAVDA